MVNQKNLGGWEFRRDPSVLLVSHLTQHARCGEGPARLLSITHSLRARLLGVDRRLLAHLGLFLRRRRLMASCPPSHLSVIRRFSQRHVQIPEEATSQQTAARPVPSTTQHSWPPHLFICHTFSPKKKKFCHNKSSLSCHKPPVPHHHTLWLCRHKFWIGPCQCSCGAEEEGPCVGRRRRYGRTYTAGVEHHYSYNLQ